MTPDSSAPPSTTKPVTGSGIKSDTSEIAQREARRHGIVQFTTIVEKLASAKGIAPAQLPAHLNISSSYWGQLKKGGSLTQIAIGDDLLRRIAVLIDESPLHTMILAGKIVTTDLVQSFTPERDLQVAIKKMQLDAKWSPYVPTDDEWELLSMRAKYGIVLMYETATYNLLMQRVEVALERGAPTTT